jgi:hypothetical protein
MNDDEFKRLTEQLLAAVARMDQRDDRLEQRLPTIMEEQTTRWLRAVSGQVESAARAGLEPSLAEGRQRIQGIATEADQTVRTLQTNRRDFASTLRWVWIGSCVSLLLSVVALVGTYEMLYGHYATRYGELKSQVTYLDALNHSDVMPCGEERLCARIDDKAPRLGDKKQYRLIELRQ